MACALMMNEHLLLASENGRQWTVVANVSTKREIDEALMVIPEGVHFLRVTRSQLDTKEKHYGQEDKQ